MKKYLLVCLILGVPLVCAALTASATYAWNSFTVNPAPVQAGGADSKDGFVVTAFQADNGRDYLAVVDYATYMGDGQKRPFLTVYEVSRKNEGKGELFLIGSRCIEWDRGFPMIGFNDDKISSPDKMKELQDPRSKDGKKKPKDD